MALFSTCMHSKHFLSNACGLLFSLDSLQRLKDQRQSQATVLGDAEVQRRQVSQDELLFGKKPVPPDLLNNNEGTGSELSTQRTTATPTSSYDSALEAEEFSRMLDSKFGAYLGTLEWSERPQSNKDHQQQISGPDWHSGASRLIAWLNQSAVPFSNLPVDLTWPDEESHNHDMYAIEMNDIEHLRRVTMVKDADPPIRYSNLTESKDYLALPLAAQVYYRKILDQYPQIRPYLARLAQGNIQRARILQWRIFGPSRQRKDYPGLDEESANQADIVQIPSETTEVETAVSPILANESIGRRLHLGNLAYKTTEENIKDFFGGYEL
jgi:hypothetical protein